MMDIFLRPCIVFVNLLPLALDILIPGTVKRKILLPGSSLQINHAYMEQLYMEIEVSPLFVFIPR